MQAKNLKTVASYMYRSIDLILEALKNAFGDPIPLIVVKSLYKRGGGVAVPFLYLLFTFAWKKFNQRRLKLSSLLVLSLCMYFFVMVFLLQSVMDSMKSFPSGHAQLTTFSAVFLMVSI
jgi:hypothetical protein